MTFLWACERSAAGGWQKTKVRWMNTTAALNRAVRSVTACGGSNGGALGDKVESLKNTRDKIIAAQDLLFTGI